MAIPKYKPAYIKAQQRKYNQGRLPTQTMISQTYTKIPKPKAAPKPYVWNQAANVNWFPGLNNMSGGKVTPKPGLDLTGIRDFLTGSSWGQTMGGGQGGGYGPTGGAGLISGDWEVQGAETDMAAGMARARGNFQAQIRQALIDLGIGDTSKLGNLSQYIDADTIKAAVENKYSRNAQTGAAAAKANAVNRAQLAARGILSSGGTTKAETDVATQAEASRFQDLRDFLSQGSAGLMGLADQEAQYARAIAQARGNAAMRAAETYPGAFAGDEAYAYQPYSASGSATASGSAAAAAARRAMLTRQQFLRKPVLAQAAGRTPAQRYANYVRAFRRQNR